MKDSSKPARERADAARELVWLRRCQAGDTIDVACLRLGKARVLHLPGELFVEYQLAAQKLRPDLFVAMAAYGDYAPGYIGTEVAYPQGGYETGPKASLVAPKVEGVLMEVIEKLLAGMRTVPDGPSHVPRGRDRRRYSSGEAGEPAAAGLASPAPRLSATGRRDTLRRLRTMLSDGATASFSKPGSPARSSAQIVLVSFLTARLSRGDDRRLTGRADTTDHHVDGGLVVTSR